MNDIQTIMNFSAKNSRAKVLIDTINELSTQNMTKAFSMSSNEYKEKNSAVIQEIFSLCDEATGVSKTLGCDLNTKRGLASALSNQTFATMYNSIIVEALANVVLNADMGAITPFVDIRNVEIGDSLTLVIEPKGLKVAQRSTYESNVAILESYTKQAVTITPKQYSLGAQMDVIRMLDGTFNVGLEIARIAQAMILAQIKLCAGLMFDTAEINGTPFFKGTFTTSNVLAMKQQLEALNGGIAPKMYGTEVALNAAGGTATQNYGFNTQDEMIRNGYLQGHAFGIDNVVLPQVTGAEFDWTDANMDKNLVLPNNMVLLASPVSSKPITLARENYVRAIVKDGNQGSLNSWSYSYFMGFDAAKASAANYGIIQVIA